MNNSPVDLKRYQSENANRYADLMSMLQDLKESCYHFGAGELAYAAKDRPSEVPMQLVANAHWLAGATLYGRVFCGSDRAFGREQFVQNLRSDLYDFHFWLLDVHKKHMNHSGNMFDEVTPTISRCNGDTGVGYIAMRVLNPRQSILHQCLRFVREMVRLLEVEAGVAYSRFQAEAERLDDYFLDNLPPVSTAVPRSP